MTLNEFLIGWGAFLSTFLALMRVWEFFGDRFRVEVTCNFMDATHGNEIFIRNLSSVPVILSSWELLWVSGRWPFRSESLLSWDEDSSDIRIDARSSHKLIFRDRYYFDWGVSSMKGRRIYLRLWIAGRRPIFRKIYG